jgi:hypothetical protein
MYLVTFRHDDVRYFVHVIDDDQFLHITTDPELAGAIDEERLPLVIRAILDRYCKVKIILDPLVV